MRAARAGEPGAETRVCSRRTDGTRLAGAAACIDG